MLKMFHINSGKVTPREEMPGTWAGILWSPGMARRRPAPPILAGLTVADEQPHYLRRDGYVDFFSRGLSNLGGETPKNR
jgi:hypothetical protein